MAILTYHHIAECPDTESGHRGLWVTPEQFARQIEWLRQKGYQALDLDSVREALLGAGALPDRWVCITFDDGFRDNLLHAAPVLRSAGFRAACFVITGSIRLGPPKGEPGEYLSAPELIDLQRSGVDIGSHTATHPRLTKLDNSAAEAELRDSRLALATILGSPPRWLAYPHGSFSPRIASIAREAGYAGAVSTIRDNRLKPDQLFWLPRVMVMDDTTPRRLGYMLSGFYHLVHAIKNRKRWSSIRT